MTTEGADVPTQQCEVPACTNEAKYASEGGLFCAVPHPYIERNPS